MPGAAKAPHGPGRDPDPVDHRHPEGRYLNPFARRIRAADRDITRGEAAYAIACHAPSPAAWRQLAEILGLEQAQPRWDRARAAAVTIAAAGTRPGGLTVNTMRDLLPARAHRLIPGTVRALILHGLIAATDRTRPSTAPGSRGWRVTVYELTASGQELARSLRPEPVPAGELEHLLPSWQAS